jgi:hypothetical protein
MALLRCLIDSMVFDAIAAEADLLRCVDRLTSARALELLAAAETMHEIEATPDAAHRRQLRRVRVLVVAPADVRHPATADLLEALLASRGVSRQDAAIAMAAALLNVPFVTEDRDLRTAVAAHLPGVATWDWAGGLRPRIVALSRAASTGRTDRSG